MLAVLVLLVVAAPAAPSTLVWTPAVQQEYHQLLTDVTDERWSSSSQTSEQSGYAALRLATFSAALLSRLPRHSDDPRITQRVRQLQRHIEHVNLGKVALDTLLRKTGNEAAANADVFSAFQDYLSRQQALASSFDMASADEMAWTPFSLHSGLHSGDVRSQLESMWSRTRPLLQELTNYLHKLALPAGNDRHQLILGCATGGDCEELIKMALPYPDVSNALADLLRQKRLGSEQLAQLADSFLQRLGLPAAPIQLWQLSRFGQKGDCDSIATADRVQLCVGGDMAGLRAALDVMVESSYWRSTSTQQPPFDDEPFPGFRAAVSGCVSLLALQPQTVQQTVYGYGTDGASNRPISLYLARGARPALRPDPTCGGDIGCQMTANWLVETTVTQLLPLGYHMASVHWLGEAASSPAPFAAWRRHMQHTLGVAVSAAPADVDTRFYSLQHHLSQLLSSYAAFQLHAAACPTGTNCVTQGRAQQVLMSVMRAGSSQPWDALLTSQTGSSAPTAEPLVAFFQPVKQLMAPATKTKRLRTFELEDDEPKVLKTEPSAVQSTGPQAPAVASACDIIPDNNKTMAELVLCNFNEQSDDMVAEVSEVEWNVAGNVTTGNVTEWVYNMTQYVDLMAWARSNITSIPSDEWVTDPSSMDEQNLWGQMLILNDTDAGEASEDLVNKLLDSTSQLYVNYISLMICPHNKKSCQGDEKLSLWDIQQLMQNMTHLEKSDLLYYWETYRYAAKHDLQSTAADYVTSANDVAKAAGLDHYGEMWLQPYGMDGDELLDQLADTWKELDSVYKKLHAFVRFQLKSIYHNEADGAKDPLPSHLLGDIYAENWVNIYNMTKMDEDVDIDISDELASMGYDAIKMTHDANTFLTGMKFDDFTPTLHPNFQEKSDLTETSCPANRDCQPLAWNAGVGDDFRLRMVSKADMDTYETVHNRMAALEYYVEYMGQDALYRGPANPAFTDAVAGAISLSVLNPKHLKAIGLIDDFNATTYYHNFLYRRALQYLVPMPFDYVTLTWLWQLFKGEISTSNWEHRWWELREDYQGVRPGNRRSASNSDPLAVPAIARGQPPFQRYFSTILQFQLFEHFCIRAGQFDPDSNATMLAECDLTGYDMKDMRTLMQAGRTQNWTELVEMYTENQTLSSDSMMRYFAPLVDRLDEIIAENHLTAEWVSNLGDYWDDGTDDDNTVPIVVGVVLGVFVLIVLIAYFVVRVRRNKEE